MSDKIKKHYNTVLEKVEVVKINGQFVVIDNHGRVQGRWKDEHHAKEHANLINSLFNGVKPNGVQKRSNNQRT